MSTTRITQRLMLERSLTAMQTSASRLARSQEQLSTGRMINRPSDSPAGANSAMRLREDLSASQQHARNASDGLAWLGRTDNTMTSMLDSTRRARDLVVQGASTGSTGSEARAALATELKQIRESVLSLANTQHLGRPLFGGTTGDDTAFVTDGAGHVTFNGTTTDVVRTIGDGVRVAVNTAGTAAFGPDGGNVFDVLDEAIERLTVGPATGLGDSLEKLDAAMSRMRTVLADVGTRYGRVESALASVNSSTIDTQAMLSEVENVDIARAIVDLQMQEVAYQAALGATARVIQPSLLDFLR
jgi:flagellar hook-associated protein 3 FlgL